MRVVHLSKGDSLELKPKELRHSRDGQNKIHPQKNPKREQREFIERKQNNML